MFPAGLEPATFRVWGGRDNHYTTETMAEQTCWQTLYAVYTSYFSFIWPRAWTSKVTLFDDKAKSNSQLQFEWRLDE